MKLKAGRALAVWALLFGLAAIASPASAQSQVQQTAAERCFAHHRFGAQPVDVAKTADGETVLAQVSWGYHDSIGCYLTLGDRALAVLRAAPPPQSLPDARTTTSLRCFAHHRFGTEPVDVAKTADRQTALARLSWGYHDAIGCYLVLDNSALATLRAAHTETTDTDATDTDPSKASPQVTPIAAGTFRSCAIKTDHTIACWGAHYSFDSGRTPSGQFTTIATGDGQFTTIVTGDGQFTPNMTANGHSCAIRTDHTIACWGNNRNGQADAPAGQYTAIAAGYGHSCAIKTDHTIACWGDNRRGLTNIPPGQFTAIAAGRIHSCAIKTDQTITCWGYRAYGRTDAPTGQYTAIAAGDGHSCAIKTDRTITCWGNNRNGQADAPAGQYTAITAGGAHSCAIKTDRTIACWGNNRNGQADAPAGQYTAIAAGYDHSCATRTDHTIACWGANHYGQISVPLGLGEPQEGILNVRMALESDPVASTDQSFEVVVEFTQVVSGFSGGDITIVNGDVTAFSGMGSEYRATVRASFPGSVVMWIRQNAVQDQSGSGNLRSRPLVASVRKTTPVAISIAAGGAHSCAIRTDQAIACWGSDYYGQANAPAGQHIAITAGSNDSCAIRTDRTIACWGRNGQVDAPPGQYTAIAAGGGHSCAIRADRTIACWGNNRSGQANAPVGQYTAIAAGGAHSCAIKTDRTIACWGNNRSGQANAPVGQYTAITAGGNHTCGIRTDETALCWGDGYYGQANAPAGQYTAIAAGSAHTCGIRTDKNVTCWGSDYHGQANAPAGQYTAIAAGSAHTCGIRTDATTQCWGENDHGQAYRPASPYAVITAGSAHSCGIRADATAQCWRENDHGLVDGTAGQYREIATGSDFVDTWDREAVLADFTAEFDRQEPDPGWTGDLARCIAGTTSQEYRDSIFQRMNWYRQMAGVLPMVEDPELSKTAQAKALILAAEGRLSHRPSPDWACYTRVDFRSESIATTSGLESIDLYMQDSGSNNEAVGHRRMITHARLDPFGTGDIPDRANTLHAQSSSGLKDVREQRGFVAWPSPGYIPYPVVWGRWSFTVQPWADFSNAAVVVVDDNGPVETEIIHNRDSALVWAMDGDSDSYGHYRPLDGDHCYVVTISGVQIEGETQAPYEYATCVTDFYE